MAESQEYLRDFHALVFVSSSCRLCILDPTFLEIEENELRIDDVIWNMNDTDVDLSKLLDEAVRYIVLQSSLQLNESRSLPKYSPILLAVVNILPLFLGLIGLIFNILALVTFSASKTFLKSSFRCYIYAFVLLNCASIIR